MRKIKYCYMQCVYVRMYVYIYACKCLYCVYACVSVHACMYVYVYDKYLNMSLLNSNRYSVEVPYQKCPSRHHKMHHTIDWKVLLWCHRASYHNPQKIIHVQLTLCPLSRPPSHHQVRHQNARTLKHLPQIILTVNQLTQYHAENHQDHLTLQESHQQ